MDNLYFVFTIHYSYSKEQVHSQVINANVLIVKVVTPKQYKSFHYPYDLLLMHQSLQN